MTIDFRLTDVVFYNLTQKFIIEKQIKNMKFKKNIIIIICAVVLIFLAVGFYILDAGNIFKNEKSMGGEREENIHPFRKAMLKKETLRSLDLQNIDLGVISPLISEFTQLEEIFLSSNSIEEIPREFFELEKLRIVDLEYNLLEEIPSDIEKLSNLEDLYLAGNNLSELPTEMGNLKNLKNLILYDNNFSREEIPALFEKPSTKIRTFCLSNSAKSQPKVEKSCLTLEAFSSKPT